MISFAYKWLGEKTTYVKSLPDYPLYKKDPHNDRVLIKDLWALFNEADVVIAHNGLQFDVKKSNARFMKHELPPPKPYKIIDTKIVAKSYCKMDSNKLDDICDYFNIGRKINTGGFELWLGCERGEKDAWKKMCEYNKHDVVLLEKVYLRMLPYMTTHPNIGLLMGNRRACPCCGSTHIVGEGTKITRTNIMQQWKCMECGSWSSSPIEGEKAKQYSQVR